MQKALFLVASSIWINVLCAQQPQELVNPFIGTTNADQPTKWGAEGGTYPGAVAPWGLVQASPETKTGQLRGYDYRDSVIYFFSLAGHSSGYPNGSAGSMKVLPLAHPRLRKKHIAGRSFRHAAEKASPGYYQVQFDDDQGSAAMTCAPRTGMLQFTFPAGAMPRVFFGEMGKLQAKSKRILHGPRQNIVLSLGADMMGMEPVEDGVIITFKPKSGENTVLVKFAISTVDHNGSMRNMEAECPGWNFNEFASANQQRWSNLLNKVTIEDSSIANKTKFYTALYHSYLVPWIISDVDGQYRGAKGGIYKTNGKNQYGKFSPWDTYRSLHPLLTLLEPEIQTDMVRSMLDTYAQTGRLPQGPMTGYHSLPVLLDSWQKGIQPVAVNYVWEAMKNSLEALSKDPDFAEYREQGFISRRFSESVTKTVEFAFNDWVMHEMAKLAGDSAAAELYASRGQQYAKLFHYPSGFILPRYQDQFVLEPESMGYKEGDKWIYSYAVQHDARGLINLMGGDSLFISKLDSALKTGIVLFDNEPVFHFPYLFNFTRQPSLSQAWVREIMENKFANTPGGIPGNDDLGSMSSWFVFSAMGFYPVSVGLPTYEMGSPLFRKMTIQLPNNKLLTIDAPNNSGANTYVKQMEFNGVAATSLAIDHNQLVQGGTLRFQMSAQPNNADTIQNFVGRSFTQQLPTINLSNITTTQTKTDPNQKVFISYQLENTGADGVVPIAVHANGKLVAQQLRFVEAGAITVDSIPVQLYKTGEYTLTVNNQPIPKLTVTASPNSPASWRVSTTNIPSFLPFNKPAEIRALVLNTGGTRCKFSIPIKVNGSVQKTETITLDPGQEKWLTTQVTATQPGLQEIEIGDSRIRSKAAETNADRMVLDIVTGHGKPAALLPDLSGFGNAGRYMEERRVMADNTTQTIHYIDIQNSQSLDVLDNELTVMAWVYPLPQEGMADIVSKGDFIVIQQTGKTLSFFAGGWGQGSCDAPLPADWENKWHHIAGVCKGRTFHLYIDGKLANTFTIDNAVNLSTKARWVVGGNEEFPDQRYFKGKINSFKVFAAALNETEIDQQMLPMD